MIPKWARCHSKSTRDPSLTEQPSDPPPARMMAAARMCHRPDGRPPRRQYEPLVSVDFKGDPHSSSVDLPFTMVLGKEKSDFVKVVTWYDNEWGYSMRTADLAALMAKSL